MQFRGIGKAALDGFLASGVQPFTQIAQAIGVDRFLEAFPEMPGDEFLMIPALRALPAQGTATKNRGFN